LTSGSAGSALADGLDEGIPNRLLADGELERDRVVMRPGLPTVPTGDGERR
jgi:hypothetical protein